MILKQRVGVMKHGNNTEFESDLIDDMTWT